jgi:RNA polymerase sigma factor (TIGR02999 family)
MLIGAPAALLPAIAGAVVQSPARELNGSSTDPYTPAPVQPGGVRVTESEPELTVLLQRWRDGDRSVEAPLAQRFYPMLRRMAGSHLRAARGAPTQSATELANEAFIRLHAQRAVDWQNRDHFFAIAASIVRRVVVDYLRARATEKRGAGMVMLSLQDLDPDELPRAPDQVDWLALDQALSGLQELDPNCARVVEMRVFGGMTIEAVAAVTGVSVPTVVRQWRFARSWLAEQIGLQP